MAFLGNGVVCAVQHPDSVDGSVESSCGIGRIGFPVMLHRSIRLECRPEAFRVSEPVVDPSGQRPEICFLVRSVLQHKKRCHPSHQRGVERIDVHAGHFRCSLHFTDTGEPFHSLLHLIRQSFPLQDILHYHRCRVEIPHTVSQMMKCPERASCGIALVEHEPGHRYVHIFQIFLPFRIICPEVCQREVEHKVVRGPEQLTVFRECPGCIRNAYVDIGLSVSGEEYRLAGDRTILVPAYAVAVELLYEILPVQSLPSVCHKRDESFPDFFHLLYILRGYLRLRLYVQLPVPAVEKHEPVGCRPFVDIWSLEVSRVVADVLECRRYDAVKEQPAFPDFFRGCYDHLVHPLFRCPFHISVKCHPGPSPAFESESVSEAAADPVPLHEGECKLPVKRSLGIYPEHESGYGCLFGIGVLVKIRDLSRNLYACPAFLPFPQK